MNKVFTLNDLVWGPHTYGSSSTNWGDYTGESGLLLQDNLLPTDAQRGSNYNQNFLKLPENDEDVFPLSLELSDQPLEYH